MTMTPTFDDIVPIILRELEKFQGEDLPKRISIVRDIFGRVSVVGPENRALQAALTESLGPYASDIGVLFSDQSTVGKQILKGSASLWRVETYDSGAEVTVQIVDRRIVGHDWLSPPSAPTGPSRRFVFGSIKGGVGRSTALAVAAAGLAQSGRNVLVVDLDLEAPGIGAILLAGDQRPIYGVIDYLVENGISGIQDIDLQQFVGTSELTDRAFGQGLVDVVPAIGTRSIQMPQNVMAKLSRALVEDTSPAGKITSVRAQIAEMISRFETSRQYDVILIDARAGLAEVSAGAILGLGATIFLFGVDQPQTFEGYSFLLSHLSQLPVDPSYDWRYDVKFVQAKAPANPDARTRFKDRLYEVVATTFYELDDGENSSLIESEPSFSFGPNDVGAPHDAWWIGFDGNYSDFDPIRDRTSLQSDVYAGAFGDFLQRLLFEIQVEEDSEIEDEIE